jgi:hypothetical protein
MVSLASVCLGASDLATAWLHHALGDSEDAHAHYEAAQHLNARIGARSWLTQARVDHAHLLLDRDHGDDRDAARRLLGLAAPAARSIGMAPAVDEIDRLQARLGAAPAEVSDRSSRRRGTFRNEGETWRLEFSGRAVRVSDARGLRDLALLLQRPGEQLSVRELVAAEQGGAPSAARGAPAFDDRARREIRDRLRDLEAEIDDAESVGDGERAALAREQRQALAEAVAKDLGRRGKPRLVGDPAERARKTVSTRIRRAIAHVARAHPELGRHLDRSIDTGAWCSYQPPEPVSWTT